MSYYSSSEFLNLTNRIYPSDPVPHGRWQAAMYKMQTAQLGMRAEQELADAHGGEVTVSRVVICLPFCCQCHRRPRYYCSVVEETGDCQSNCCVRVYRSELLASIPHLTLPFDAGGIRTSSRILSSSTAAFKRLEIRLASIPSHSFGARVTGETQTRSTPAAKRLWTNGRAKTHLH